MSLHINRFIDSIKAAESRGSKDLLMTLRDARDLHGDITKLLLAMEHLRHSNQAESQPIQVEITGGNFKST
jgi:hypothetical protein